MESNESGAIRILIADDTNLIRKALTIYCEADPNLEVIGTAENGNFALKLIRELKPNIVLMDLEMPEMDGVTATRIMRQFFPSVKVLIISSHKSQNYIDQALKAGASGYFIKSTPAKTLLKAIKLIYEQNVRVIPDISTQNAYKILPSLLATESPNQSKSSCKPLILVLISKLKSCINRCINLQRKIILSNLSK